MVSWEKVFRVTHPLELQFTLDPSGKAVRRAEPEPECIQQGRATDKRHL